MTSSIFERSGHRFASRKCDDTKASAPVENQPENPMNLSFSLKNLLPLLAIILGIASIVAPRFLNVFVAVFLIAFGILGLGLIR
jgi:hypothetical protein